MKRIFISVGSEGLKALSELLNRLCMENMFDKFDDYYIAFDSMQSEVDSFNKIRDAQKTNRIQGYVMTINEEDFCVQKSFHEEWTETAVPAGGVGGRRTISMKAASIIKRVWNDPNLGLDSQLKPDDHIIVVGSAFGGTSGGMFINVCQFLDLVIREKRKIDSSPTYNNVQVLGFLLMPEGVSSDDDYPTALNMIDMFRDLQTISWQRRLESDRPGFKVPTWAQYNKKGYFPLFAETTAGSHKILEYGISGSSLPMGTLYLIPTPIGQQQYVRSIYAETLFVASYLRVDEGHGYWVNRTSRGDFGPQANLNVEDKCIAGFNMFAMKSGRMLSLKNWFGKGILSAIRGKNQHGGLCSVLGADPEIQSNIVAVFQKAQVPCKDVDPLAGFPHQPGTALNALLEAVRIASQNKIAFRDFPSRCQDLLETIKTQAEAFKVIPAKELITLLGTGNEEYTSWNGEVNFTLIKQAYAEFHAILQTEGNNVELYSTNLKAAIKEATNLIDFRTKHRVVRNSIWGLSQEDAVFKEISKAFTDAFETLLRRYLFACRCAKTTFMSPQAFNKEADDFEGICQNIEDEIKNELANLGKDKNPFIAEGILVDPLVLPPAEEKKLAFDPLNILLSAAYRTAVPTAQENKFLLECIDNLGGANRLLEDHLSLTGQQILDKAEESAIAQFIKVTEDLVPAANPLSAATFTNFADRKQENQCHTHAPELRVPDSDQFHYHFVIQQGTPPATFTMLNKDVASAPLNLTTMPNTAAAASPFLSMPHNIGMRDANYWKDERTPTSPIFCGLKPGCKVDVQGLWIGTLGIDFAVRDALNKIYASVPHVQADWIAAGLSSTHPRRLLTTVEMLRFGLLIEAVEEKIQQAWKLRISKPNHGADRVASCDSPVTITFNNPTKKPVSLSTDAFKNIGFSDDEDQGCKMTQISLKWTKEILDWIRDPGINGFEAFYPNSKFSTVKNTEYNIFTDIRFSILPSEINEMNILKNAISASLQISGI